MSDEEIERLLSVLDIRSFHTPDEQEVAGYAKAMDLVFDGWQAMELIGRACSGRPPPSMEANFAKSPRGLALGPACGRGVFDMRPP